MQSLLDRLLVTLEVRLEAFALLDISVDRRLVFEGLDSAIVHYVLEGSGWLEVPGGEPYAIRAGNVLIVPPGAAQSLRAGDSPSIDVNAGEHCAMVKDGLIRFDGTDGGPPDLRLLCGSVMANASGSFGLFDALKRPLTETFDGLPLIEGTFDAMRSEIIAPSLGTRALVGSLMKVALLLLVRRQIEAFSAASPLTEPTDNRLLRAVTLVLDMPAAEHSVASLARSAGMSRSQFAQAFHQQFHQTPMEFVAKTRLHHAAELLRGTDLPVKVIAGSIGFASRSAFTRAFRVAYGNDPSAYRKAVGATLAPRHLVGSRRRFALPAEPEDQE